MRNLIILIFIFFSSLGAYLYGGNVSPEDAKKVAVNWKTYIRNSRQTTDHRPQSKVKSQKALSISQSIKSQIPNIYKGITTFYTFTFKGGGFVIVAADDNINPVLAYSDTDSVPENIKNENIKYWLDKYNKEIHTYITQKSKVKTQNLIAQKQWNNILNNTFEEKGNKKTGPLLKTLWDQGCYYDASCPVDNNGECGHVVTGCIATALAQIMKYNNYPMKGIGSFSYKDSPYGTLSANFENTTYNWTNMPNKVTSANTSVATLMYQCGVAVKMQYGPKESGTTTTLALNALKNYFGYTSASLIIESDYSFSDWEDTLKANLNQSLPMLYVGTDKNYGGHAFVCDGYETLSNSNYFHFNWGWSGDYNGFYLLTTMNPVTGLSLTSDEMAIINIIPGYNVSGSLYYDNSYKTPLTGQKVVLINGASSNNTLTSTTDANGNYSFNNVLPGSYTITPQINLLPGGFNPIDALLCNKFNYNLYSFTDSLLLYAADVSTDKSMNSSDAVLINQRYTGIINSFKPLADWTYLHKPIQVINSNVSRNCPVVCTGDVTGSYDFTVHKLTNFSVLSKGVFNIQANGEFEMPVYINDTVNIGALGLLLIISDTLFQIKDIIPNIQGMLYKFSGSRVNIAWSANNHSYRINPAVALFYLKIIYKGDELSDGLSFSVDDGSLIADFNEKLFKNENIAIPKLVVSSEPNNLIISIFPNPVSQQTAISYQLSTKSHVTLDIFDLTGRKVSTLVYGVKEIGEYSMQFNAEGLRSGVYFVKLSTDSGAKTVKFVKL